MLKNNKIRLIAITSLIILLLIIAGILVAKSDGTNKIVGLFQKEEIKKEITYEIYSLVDNKMKILVSAEDTENGLEKIQYPNNELELNCNGKNKVAIDYEINTAQDATYTFVAINSLGEHITNTININDAYRNNELKNAINVTIQKESDSQVGIAVNFKQDATTKQYKIGETATNWTNYVTPITIDSYQVKEAGESNNINVYLRQIDKAGNEIVTLNTVPLKDVTYNTEDTVITGESILACVENNTLQSGNYIFSVTGLTDGISSETIEYPVELYNYSEDANYIAASDVVIGNKSYKGIGKSTDEKRMLILKYNGKLTLGESAIITPTVTDATINGVTGLCTKKGMLIYCAGTIENNGTISMTARGTVNEAGENVYLSKNANGTYEYVPAIGADGGVSIGGSSTASQSRPGSEGTNRQTGGGGSGCGWTHGNGSWNKGGNGGSGTAYSGGTGGGGASNGATGGNGSSTGGTGGAGRSTSGSAAPGGTGNPGGAGANGSYYGNTGTGGLLTIASTSLMNNGNINSNGVSGVTGYEYQFNCSSGSSGGGSINIFYKINIEGKLPQALGGSASGRGGTGGNGSVTITQIQ